MTDRIPGFTSTGSKRPEALFGAGAADDLPRRLSRSHGCRVWDERGRPYLDYIMALGAVALGYAHPEVVQAAAAAAADGGVGSLPPVLEEELAADLCALVPNVERVRFLKTGAEAMAAAVRLARAFTGRDRVLGCGYHGWLDWCEPEALGVPAEVSSLYGRVPYNQPEETRRVIRAAGGRLAAVAFEPIILAEPSAEWLTTLREETDRAGAVLIADEIKTIGRVALGGAAERYRFRPDLIVMAKAIANGFPLAVVGGRADVMETANHTWISSTLATETVALSAARATLAVLRRDRVPEYLERVGRLLFNGLVELAQQYPQLALAVEGIPQMCAIRWTDDTVGTRVAAECARRGILLKRSAYNFVSLAHQPGDIEQSLGLIGEAMAAC